MPTVAQYVRLDQEQIARLINETLIPLNLMFNDIPPKHWADQDPAQRRVLTQIVRFVAENPQGTPERYHDLVTGRMRDEGWSAGDHRDSTRKLDPMARPYSELSPKHRYRMALVFAMARHMLAPPQAG